MLVMMMEGKSVDSLVHSMVLTTALRMVEQMAKRKVLRKAARTVVKKARLMVGQRVGTKVSRMAG